MVKILDTPTVEALAVMLEAALTRSAPPKIEGGSPARQQWLRDVIAVQMAFHAVGADEAFRSAWIGCGHLNTTDHHDNPSRFRCLDCGVSFADYGEGYVAV